MESIKQGWDAFQVFLDTNMPPLLSDADTRVRNDSAWTEAALAYSMAKRQADETDQKLEVARNALIALAEHPKEQGAGVSVTRFWKQGSVNYKAVPQLEGINLNAYRGKAREETRISESK